MSDSAIIKHYAASNSIVQLAWYYAVKAYIVCSFLNT